MEEKTLLNRSPAGLQVQIITIGIVAIVVAVLSIWLISKLFSVVEGSGFALKIMVVLLFAVAWLLGSTKLWFDWHIKRYEIAADALIVYAKAGKLGKSQTVYRYESMISIRTSQNFLGKRFGYGDVFITIPKLDKEVVMNDIENPFEQLAEVQKRMGERSAGTHTLVT